MRRLGIFAALLPFLFMTQTALAQPPGVVAIMGLTPDIAAGGELWANSCAECHGSNGNSNKAHVPRLAGQIRNYELLQLWAFRERERIGVMTPRAENLSDQDIADVTAYVSSQNRGRRPWPTQDPMLVEQGAALFNQGNHTTGVIACAVCHGLNGEGVEQLGIPRIRGQAPDYLKAALNIYANYPDEAIPDISNAMAINTSRLSEQEIDAIVAFLASQLWSGP